MHDVHNRNAPTERKRPRIPKDRKPKEENAWEGKKKEDDLGALQEGEILCSPERKYTDWPFLVLDVTCGDWGEEKEHAQSTYNSEPLALVFLYTVVIQPSQQNWRRGFNILGGKTGCSYRRRQQGWVTWVLPVTRSVDSGKDSTSVCLSFSSMKWGQK